MGVIAAVKAKLPEPLPSDELLELYIEEVGQAIRTHCNREDIPNELRFVHANMVVDMIAGESRRTEADGGTAVSSIKEGDVTVQFGSAKVESRERSTESVIYGYVNQLNRFRKIRR